MPLDPTTAPEDKRRREAADDYVKGMINKSPTAYYGFLDGCAHEAEVLAPEIKQLGENVTHWMKESFKWNKRSQAERARIEKLREALLAHNAECMGVFCHTCRRNAQLIAEDDRLKEQE